MHDARTRGARTGHFHEGVRDAAVRRADIERRLAGAVERDEIVVHYQPIVDLTTSTVTGFEALARWRQGDVLVPPAHWVPVAEATELIGEIGEHVLNVAVQQATRWQARGRDIGVSVNVSARQLALSSFMRLVRDSSRQLPPERLCLEVTESLALDTDAQEQLREVEQLGVRIALDDFGTGYSALAAIAQLPIAEVKIDRSITSRIDRPDGRALISATLAIASALGLDVVAEGVERRHEHTALVGLNCSKAQGYLYGRPAAAESATALLEAGPRWDAGAGTGLPATSPS